MRRRNGLIALGALAIGTLSGLVVPGASIDGLWRHPHLQTAQAGASSSGPETYLGAETRTYSESEARTYTEAERRTYTEAERRTYTDAEARTYSEAAARTSSEAEERTYAYREDWPGD